MMSKGKDFLRKYWIAILAGLLAVGIVIYFVNIIFFQRKETVMSVLVLGAEDSIDADLMEEELRKKLDAVSEEKEFSIVFMDPGIAENQAIILTRIRARTVDLIIAGREGYDMAASAGICADLKEALPAALYQKAGGDLVTGSVAVYDDDGAVTGTEEEREYGISLSNSSTFEPFNREMENPIVSVVVNTERLQNCILGIEYLIMQTK